MRVLRTAHGTWQPHVRSCFQGYVHLTHWLHVQRASWVLLAVCPAAPSPEPSTAQPLPHPTGPRSPEGHGSLDPCLLGVTVDQSASWQSGQRGPSCILLPLCHTTPMSPVGPPPSVLSPYGPWAALPSWCPGAHVAG